MRITRTSQGYEIALTLHNVDEIIDEPTQSALADALDEDHPLNEMLIQLTNLRHAEDSPLGDSDDE